jgi:repressor LexA
MDIDSLPPRQKDVLKAILHLTNKHGYAPTLAELAKALGLKNRMTIHQHVVALKNKGLVKWEPGLNRSLRVIGDHELEDMQEEEQTRVPLIGTIAAGRPIDAFENKEYLDVDSSYGEKGCFALKIKGDSMIEDGIYDGDFVIVKPTPTASNGEIVVALLQDGTATLKRFYKEKGRYRLQPANADMEPIYVDGKQKLTIQGTAVALFRKLS